MRLRLQEFTLPPGPIIGPHGYSEATTANADNNETRRKNTDDRKSPGQDKVMEEVSKQRVKMIASLQNQSEVPTGIAKQVQKMLMTKA